MKIKNVFLALLAIILFLGAQSIFAWVEPTTVPPGNNIFAPLNSSAFGQSKVGGLILNLGNAAHGLIVRYGLVGIGTDNPQAALDVSSTSSGVLFPRMNTAQRDAIGTKVEGLLIYNTETKQLEIYSDGAWKASSGGGDSLPKGTIAFFNLSACPSGWTEKTELKGRYPIGLPTSGTLGQSVGTALTNGEDRATGQHTHTASQAPHDHEYAVPCHWCGGPPNSWSLESVPGGVFWLNRTNSTAPTVSVANTGSVAGTNAPYVQLLACEKQTAGSSGSGGSTASSFWQKVATNNDIYYTDGSVGVGTSTPSARLDVANGSVRTSSQLISTVATGTAPIAVNSSTTVPNLNVDLLDGRHASDFLASDTVVRLSAVRYYSSSSTWVKPTNLSYITVEVWGGGGGGGSSSWYGSTGGGTSSFGNFLSATGGGTPLYGGGNNSFANGGVGSGGDINLPGQKSSSKGGNSPRGGNGGESGWTQQESIPAMAPGGGGSGSYDKIDSGGGGGGYSKKMIPANSLSSSHIVTVGGGGSKGSYNNCQDGAAGAVVIYEYTTVPSGTDLAENYPVKDPSVSAGDIVSFDNNNPIGVKRAVPEDTMPLAGVVSTKPGMVLTDNQKDATGQRPIALSGRVPTKVNLEGGEIKIGDRIALSSVPGTGKLAKSSESSIGYALEPFGKESKNDKIEVFINLSNRINEVSQKTDEKSSPQIIEKPASDKYGWEKPALVLLICLNFFLLYSNWKNSLALKKIQLRKDFKPKKKV